MGEEGLTDIKNLPRSWGTVTCVWKWRERHLKGRQEILVQRYRSGETQCHRRRDSTAWMCTRQPSCHPRPQQRHSQYCAPRHQRCVLERWIGTVGERLRSLSIHPGAWLSPLSHPFPTHSFENFPSACIWGQGQRVVPLKRKCCAFFWSHGL